MEKKTIGGLIAALRRASGMTQKDLAERLNVSDKTVSRWERDDGALQFLEVLTWDEYYRGRDSLETFNVLFGLAYAVEYLLAAGGYLFIRRKV